MKATPEHEFIAKCTDEVLSRFSDIRLIGVTESERRMFDYSCVLTRDCSRPLVAQLLWSHQEGIDKDLRTLLPRCGVANKGVPRQRYDSGSIQN